MDKLKNKENISKTIYIPKNYKLALSVIPNAGLGIFTEIDIPKDTIIGKYKGQWLTPNQYDKLSNKIDLLYVWQIYDYLENKQRPKTQKFDSSKILGYIDGRFKKYSNFLRYVNHPRTKLEENVYAEQQKSDIIYVSSRDIKAGEELMVNYGPDYSKHLINVEVLPDE